MKLETARKFALSLPETTEQPHFEKSSFRVKGKILATVPEVGKHLHIAVVDGEASVLIDENPKAIGAIVSGKRIRPDWVRVNLVAADRALVRELLEDAWRLKAPPKVLAAFDAK